MSAGRRRNTPTEEETDPGPMAGLEEAQDRLSTWSDDDRARYLELLEDAGSELQREMIHRGLAAGRTPIELHSFADAIRTWSDEDVFGACTPPRSGHPLAVLLGAQADPLAAFEINGHRLRSSRPRRGGAAPARTPPALIVDRAVAPARPAQPARGRFEAEATGVHRRSDLADLGHSDAGTAKQREVPGCFAEDLFNAAGAALGVRFDEQAVDLGKLTLERALPGAAAALAAGVPVPVILGQAPGDFRRYALIVQMQVSGRNHAYELYDPVSHELVWANEGDLLARAELPFSDKVNRRITAIALPRLDTPRPTRDSSFEGRR